MKCPDQITDLMHDYLDEDIDREQEGILREHLKACKECETVFNELIKTVALVKGTSGLKAPEHFTANVMALLPKEKKKVSMQRWFKNHPFLSAASVFIILMIGSVFSTWSQNRDFSVSKQQNLIVKNNTVIVPKGEVVKGNVVVRNGNLRIEGEIQGDATVINGNKYLASAGHVTGQIEVVNQVFDWIWYQMKKTAHEVVDIFDQTAAD